MEDQTAKEHHKRQAGPKAEKRKAKNKHEQELTAKQRNPKAFSYHSVNKVARSVRRTLDVRERKHHNPVIDRTPVEPPPVLIAVVGPPKVGKSTLIQCLVRNFTKQKLSNVKGPVTLVSGKKRRLTFIECNNDINSMIDLAKVADLILLLVDASFGFEMETFEFLNICQTHGFPKIMGILTHLDTFKNNKALSKMKKRLKHRFWTEIYAGAKLFYLSGMVHEEYQQTEIHNLGRFISVMKFRPLVWRTTHPYLLSDRMEDVTEAEIIRKQPKCDRNICLYGYVRGTHLHTDSSVHVPGCGDYRIDDISYLPDPCPLPNRDGQSKRSLNERERLIYAPLSGVGGIVYDKDAVYIEMGSGAEAQRAKKEKEGPTNQLVSNIIETRTTMDEKMASSKLSIFKTGVPITSKQNTFSFPEEKVVTVNGRKRRKAIFSGSDASDDEDMSEDEGGSEDEDISSQEEAGDSEDNSLEEDEEEEGSEQEISEDEDGDVSMEDDEEEEEVNESEEDSDKQENIEFEDESETEKKPRGLLSSSEEEDEDDDNEDEGPQWKNNMIKKASAAFMKRKNEKFNLRKLVYGDIEEEDEHSDVEEDSELGGMFRISKKGLNLGRRAKDIDSIDSICHQHSSTRDWSQEQVRESIKDCFVTGKWDASEDAKTLLDADDDIMDGDFEDFETGEKHMAGDGSDADGSSDDSGEETFGYYASRIRPFIDDRVVETREERRKRRTDAKRAEKKKRMKALFDNAYDAGDTDPSAAGGTKTTFYEDQKAALLEQANLNRDEFDKLDEPTRAKYEGFRPGVYVRLQLNSIPCELVTNFDPTYPLIVGGLLSAEQNIGYVQARIKKHRWHKRILKTRDPWIVSMGWRRFQSIALFSMQDHNGRNRALKYTPEHLHCNATFYGPITPQGTGILSIPTVASNTPEFRISATGVVLELDKATSIVKKLKLTGTPFKVFKKTAFIQGMFNTNMEVAKFEGGKIQTVSGIRGQIKKLVKEGGKEGSFRATFEDKILMSDIVFVRTWYSVAVPEFYLPLTNLLMVEKNTWKGMKTVGQLRRESNLKRDVDADSLYKPIERQTKQVKALVIPKALQRALPFNDKPKITKLAKDEIAEGRVAIIRDAKEKKVADMLKMMKTVHDAKQKKRTIAMRSRAIKHHAELAERRTAIDASSKVKKKEAYRIMGQKEKVAQKKSKGR